MTAVAAPSHVPAYLAHLYPLPKPSQRKGEKPSAERRAVIRQAVALIVAEHGLSRRKDGTLFRWSEPAARDLFALVDAMLSVHPGTIREPSLGVCLRCGEPTASRVDDVLKGKGACNSWACGGRSMPPTDLIIGKLAARGFELVGDLPKRSKEKMSLRHTGFDPLVERKPCSQEFASSWDEINHLGVGCGVCRGRQVAVGYNDIASVRPDLVDRFVDPDVARTVTVSSHTMVDVWCSREHDDGSPCRNVVRQKVDNLTKGNRAQCKDHGGRKPTESDGWVYAFAGEHEQSGIFAIKPTGFAGGVDGWRKREGDHSAKFVGLLPTGAFYFAEPGLAFMVEQQDLALLSGLGIEFNTVTDVRTRSDGTEVTSVRRETTDGHEYMLRIGDAGLWAHRDLLAQHPDLLSDDASAEAVEVTQALVDMLALEYGGHSRDC